MKKLAAFLTLATWWLPAPATEITLTAGYQFSSDFEVAGSAERPPVVPPDTGEPGEDVPVDDAVAISLAIDFVFENQPTKRIGLFVSHSQTQFDANTGLANRDLDITHIHFTAMSYYPEGRLEPFVMAGIGAGLFSPRDSALRDETMLSAQVAAGANYRFSDRLLLRMDVRWLPSFFDGSGAVFCSGGCTIVLSSETYSQIQANVGLVYRF